MRAERTEKVTLETSTVNNEFFTIREDVFARNRRH